MLKIFSDYKIVGCENKKDTEAMDVIIFNASQLVLYLDGYLGKIARFAALNVPDLLKLFICWDERSAKFNKIHKRKFPTLLTPRLD